MARRERSIHLISLDLITCRQVQVQVGSFFPGPGTRHVVLVLPPPRVIGFPRGYPQRRLSQLQAPLLCIAYNRQYKYTIQFQGEHSKNLGHSKEPCTVTHYTEQNRHRQKAICFLRSSSEEPKEDRVGLVARRWRGFINVHFLL